MKCISVAADRTSKVTFAELHPQAKHIVAADFLRQVLDNLPFKNQTLLTNNGIHFTLLSHQWFPGGHSFARICRAFDVEHRLAKPAYPYTNGGLG